MDNSISKKYAKGFNASYLIAEYKPKLIDSLLKSEINNDFMRGMKAGKQMLEKEKNKVLSKTKSRLQELQNTRSINKERGLGLER